MGVRAACRWWQKMPASCPGRRARCRAASPEMQTQASVQALSQICYNGRCSRSLKHTTTAPLSAEENAQGLREDQKNLRTDSSLGPSSASMRPSPKITYKTATHKWK